MLKKAFLFTVLVGVAGGANYQSGFMLGPVVPTSLTPGVYSGTIDCDVRITAPDGVQRIEPNRGTVTFEIDEQGIPIAEGQPIRTGRTIELAGLRVTYTRVAALDDGVVIHSATSGSANGVSYQGSAIATLSEIEVGVIEYHLTHTWLDVQGFGYNQDCTMLLE